MAETRASIRLGGGWKRSMRSGGTFVSAPSMDQGVADQIAAFAKEHGGFELVLWPAKKDHDRSPDFDVVVQAPYQQSKARATEPKDDDIPF